MNSSSGTLPFAELIRPASEMRFPLKSTSISSETSFKSEVAQLTSTALPQRHQRLHLPRKLTLKRHQILRLWQKVTLHRRQRFLSVTFSSCDSMFLCLFSFCDIFFLWLFLSDCHDLKSRFFGSFSTKLPLTTPRCRSLSCIVILSVMFASSSVGCLGIQTMS